MSYMSQPNNRSTSLPRGKSVSTNTFLKQQSSATHPSAAYQSKLDRLVKKLLKAGADGDLGMVKFLLHWNQPSKGGSDDVFSSNTANTERPATSCHPLCDCDNCVKMVSYNSLWCM